MYADLVNLHYDGGLEKCHERRFGYLRSVDAEEDTTEHIEWCIENLDMDSWTWGWNMGNDLFDQGFHVFTFRMEEDAMLFSLTWQ